MAPWGLCLHEGLLCPSLSECLPASLFLVRWPLNALPKRGGVISAASWAGRWGMFITIHLAPHVPPGTPSTQHTEVLFLFARRNECFAGNKRQWFPPWHSQPSVMLAMAMDAYPQGQGFVTDLCWSRICFIPLIFCVAEETDQFKFIQDGGLRDALHCWAICLHFHPSSRLFWSCKACFDPLQTPTQGTSYSSRSYQASSVKKYKVREGFEIYFSPVYHFPTNIFNLRYWCGWISLPCVCASLASHSSN